ncbi:MAG: hypothetical protein ACQKBY_07590 [Verrucomicrobiales bacterium]
MKTSVHPPACRYPLLAIFPLLLTSCEDKALVAERAAQQAKIQELGETFKKLREARASEEFRDIKSDLQSLDEQAEKLQAEAETLRAEAAELLQEEIAVKEKSEQYRRDYPIRNFN